ncbi:MAG: DUF4405 domain-containing protein [Methanoregula sp.]|uniref:DUF4405 domain-containing protein n=1 Tax=Methanoregula sp. TaxID=2052170 RepID=UPI003BAE78F1
MDRFVVTWVVDLLMGITFMICFITGLLKFSVLLQVTGLNEVILPAAFISDLHDWSGILLGLFVFLHLFMNRRWIVSIGRKMLGKT